MKRLTLVLPWLFVVLVATGCASSSVTASRSYPVGETIARPNRILVYDFAATADDLAAYSATAGRYAQHETPQTAEEIERGRALGAQVAEALVAEIRNMGLPAMRAAGRPAPQVGDMVISGEFVSIEWGSRGMRMSIGFGSGRTELRTVVEGYLVTDQGLRPLKSREIEARGGGMPGLLVPIAVTAATASPVGLIVGGAAQLSGEAGRNTMAGMARRTANEIAGELRAEFKRLGWI